MIEKLIVVIGFFGLVLAVFAALGALLAWLFRQFGIVHPWFVYSLAWLVFGLIVNVFRGGK